MVVSQERLNAKGKTLLCVSFMTKNIPDIIALGLLLHEVGCFLRAGHIFIWEDTLGFPIQNFQNIHICKICTFLHIMYFFAHYDAVFAMAQFYS